MPGMKDRGKRVPEERVPVVRLAIAANQGTTEGTNDLNYQGFGKREASPTIRLATTILGGATSSENLERGINPPPREAPSVYLAHVPGAQGDNNLLGRNGVEPLPPESRPALLVSYVYLEPFLVNKHRYCYRDWVMDSGAFSAENSGKKIDLQAYIDCCKELQSQDPTLTEIFALDVIGDWKASLRNAEEMWRQRVEAIPTFHYGSPWDVLKGIAKDYPKIALGGCVGRRDKDKFAEQCFARVWPARIHGFGFGSEKSIMALPFHSCDATNWEMGPCAWGRWNAFGGQHISVRGSKQNLRAEVEWYLDLEQKARQKWKKQMQELAELPLTKPSAVLAISDVQKGGNCIQQIEDALKPRDPPPSIRLTANGNTVGPRQKDALAPTVRLAQKESRREEGKGLIKPKKKE